MIVTQGAQQYWEIHYVWLRCDLANWRTRGIEAKERNRKKKKIKKTERTKKGIQTCMVRLYTCFFLLLFCPAGRDKSGWKTQKKGESRQQQCLPTHTVLIWPVCCGSGVLFVCLCLLLHPALVWIVALVFVVLPPSSLMINGNEFIE